jgi:hypothetical protein
LSSKKSFRFPSTKNPVKVDVLVPLVTGHFVVKPGETRYLLEFGADAKMACELEVQPSGSNNGPAEASSKIALEDISTQRQDAAFGAQAYIEQHGILEFIQSALKAVIRDKPEDPHVAMGRLFMAACPGANGYQDSMQPIKPEGSPSKAPARKFIADPEIQQQEVASNNDAIQASALGDIPDDEKTAEAALRIQSIQRGKAARAEVAEKKEKVRKENEDTTKAATTSGSQENVDVYALRKQVCAAMLDSMMDGRLEKSLELELSSRAQPREDMEDIRTRAQEAMFVALEDGSLQKSLESNAAAMMLRDIGEDQGFARAADNETVNCVEDGSLQKSLNSNAAVTMLRDIGEDQGFARAADNETDTVDWQAKEAEAALRIQSIQRGKEARKDVERLKNLAASEGAVQEADIDGRFVDAEVADKVDQAVDSAIKVVAAELVVNGLGQAALACNTVNPVAAAGLALAAADFASGISDNTIALGLAREGLEAAQAGSATSEGLVRAAANAAMTAAQPPSFDETNATLEEARAQSEGAGKL